MTSRSFARPPGERCDRPTKASARSEGSHPGRLAQGPEEKLGLSGRVVGFMARHSSTVAPVCKALFANPGNLPGPSIVVARMKALRAAPGDPGVALFLVSAGILADAHAVRE